MKIFFSILMILILALLLNACEKSAPNTIQGKWNVVSDSSIIAGATISYVVYKGNFGDYFDFSTDGILHTKETNLYDTISCKQKSDSTITFDKIGIAINTIPQTGIYILSVNKLKIVVTPDLTNPGFSFKRIINLKR